MDISDTLAPKSDQLNADDLISGPMTVTIVEVKRGSLEQPVELHLEGLNGRPYKPGKSMRRVIVAAWGAEANVYVGRSLTLYNDQSIKFGKDVTGGIRISHMTHIDKPLQVALTMTRGKRAPFTVQPLTAPSSSKPNNRVSAAAAAITAAETVEALDAVWGRVRAGGLDSDPTLTAAYDERARALSEVTS